METAGDPDVRRVWTLLSDVSEQLSQNRTSAVNLHALADGAKAQAIHSQSGFFLRRFNLDKPKEVYDAELERMNAAMSAENQTLLNDNRQLSALIREYEQTLENVMETFRTRAHEVQQHELTFMRQYESLIVQRESEALEASLTVTNARSESFARAGRMLRAVMRRLGGEDISVYEAHLAHMSQGGRSDKSREPSSTSEEAATSVPASEEAARPEEESMRKDKGKARDDSTHTEDDESEDGDHGSQDGDGGDESPHLPERDLSIDRILDEEDNPEKRLATAEWALERECELARLERENEELRALLNGSLKPETSTPPTATATQTHRAIDSTSSIPISILDHHNGEGEGEDRSSDKPSSSTGPRPRLLGGPPGRVGPFGTYKKSWASG